MDLIESEFRLGVFGEILTGEGFDSSFPVSIQFFIHLPPGWRREYPDEQKSTVSSYPNSSGVCNFSQVFTSMLIGSASSDVNTLENDRTEHVSGIGVPILCLTAIGFDEDGTILHEVAYGSEYLPLSPGVHNMKIKTMRLAKRNIPMKLRDLFLGIQPSITDVNILNPPKTGGFMSLIELDTVPCGSVNIRLRIMCQSSSRIETNNSGQPRMDFIYNRINSTTLLQTVQNVIQAFQEARNKARQNKIQR